MPVAHREAQMFFERLAEHPFAFVVMAVCKRVVRLRPFIADLGDVFEVRHRRLQFYVAPQPETAAMPVDQGDAMLPRARCIGNCEIAQRA
jgi:hypothetical protein